MQDVLLLTVVAAMFVLGWFVVKRLNRFLENNRQAQDVELLSMRETLKIGLSNPLFSDSLTNILEQYCKMRPDSSVRIFYGAEDELVKGLVCKKLDIIFLPENALCPDEGRCGTRKVLLNYTPVIMKYGGLPIEPIAEKAVAQKALWLKEHPASSVDCFIGCMK